MSTRFRSARTARLIAATLTLGVAAAGIAQAREASAPRDQGRFHSSRSGAALPLPAEDAAFRFVVFGDRTGGPEDGVRVLEQAVAEANLLAPDLVMTVGDLVQGYNTTEPWLEQMREFRGIMDGLDCPWFPVAGNHDIYYRGDDAPRGGHEASFEKYFGPLWYAFEHKKSRFIVLYSDEGDPESGLQSYDEPIAQRMSDAQFAWLKQTLEDAAAAENVFVFLHHPRWRGANYGDDWDRVHAALAAAGNVRAVFAGHIHRMAFDGTRDGIEYMTLATVGGSQKGFAADAGFLHQFHVVTVRGERIALASVPVGTLMDVRAVTRSVSEAGEAFAGWQPEIRGAIDVSADAGARGRVGIVLPNPFDAPIEYEVVASSGDPHWTFAPGEARVRVDPDETRTLEIGVRRPAGSMSELHDAPVVTIAIDYVSNGSPIALHPVREELPVSPRFPGKANDGTGELVLDGVSGALLVPSARLPLDAGPFTLECRFLAAGFGERVGLVSKSEHSDYGLFISEGRPEFRLALDGSTAHAVSTRRVQEGRWAHVAAVHDGEECRLYVDGRIARRVATRGLRRSNALPLVIGGDVDANGDPMSLFHGRIDDVRLSSVARYVGRRFDVPTAFVPDADTLLLLTMDRELGPWVRDASGRDAHATRVGGAMLASPLKDASRGSSR